MGLALDTNRTLHLYIDGQHLGVVAPDVADPCYVMIDVYACWKKVWAWRLVKDYRTNGMLL